MTEIKRYKSAIRSRYNILQEIALLLGNLIWKYWYDSLKGLTLYD